MHTGNCANWILGHMIFAHNRVMELAGAEPVWENEALPRLAVEPVTGEHDAFDWDTMTSAFFDSRDRLMAALAGHPGAIRGPEPPKTDAAAG